MQRKRRNKGAESADAAREKRLIGKIRDIILAMGDDPYREGIEDTPARVITSWKELYAGYTTNIPDLFKVFDKPHDQMVVARDIEFWSTCEHHMLPFYGTAHVAYIPKGEKVVGLSKLARIVDAFARRLQIQERLTEQVTSAIDRYLAPRGSACIITAKHMCVCCRGVGKQQMEMVTSSVTGCFRDEPETRSELFALIGVSR